LQVREYAPTFFFFHYFALGPTLESLKEFGGMLVDLCSIPPSLELETCYHVGIEIFIDDERKKINVQEIFGLFLSLIVLHLY
jgi:hypothetical protein